MAGTSTATRELRNIRDTLHTLGTAFLNLGMSIKLDGRPATPRARQPLRLTESRQKALKLQGTYMGTMRGLKPRQRAQVKRIRVEKGIREAITVARRMSR